MAQSISSAQSSFLSSGALSNLGTTEQFEPTESQSALVRLAALLIETAQTNLHEDGQVSSGALSDSFKVNDPQAKGNAIKLDIEALNYYDYQNKGVRGTVSGASGANYSFKNNFPSEAMVTAIAAWIERGKLSTANVKKTISKHEEKGKAISAYDRAYTVARGVKMHGIKGTGYFDKAVKIAQAYAKDILGQALAVDVIRALPKNLNNGNRN